MKKSNTELILKTLLHILRTIEEKDYFLEQDLKETLREIEKERKTQENKMGWGYCGVNTDTGEEMGYTVKGVCHHIDCHTDINHGLGCLCGNMHQSGQTCGHYFCGKHLTFGVIDGEIIQMCHKCYDKYNEEE
jgi:hypothetical protein